MVLNKQETPSSQKSPAGNTVGLTQALSAGPAINISGSAMLSILLCLAIVCLGYAGVRPAGGNQCFDIVAEDGFHIVHGIKEDA